MLSNEDLEKIEYRYLETISNALKSSVSSMVDGLKSMNKIKDYWSKTHKRGDGFDSGFERIIYSVLQSNTTDLGKPNSCLVGADLFFESPDAFIHIDAKSYQPRTNTKDHWRNKIEANQSSYKTNYQVSNDQRIFEPNLPSYYNIDGSEKPALTYFVNILYSSEFDQNDIVRSAFVKEYIISKLNNGIV